MKAIYLQFVIQYTSLPLLSVLTPLPSTEVPLTLIKLLEFLDIIQTERATDIPDSEFWNKKPRRLARYGASNVYCYIITVYFSLLLMNCPDNTNQNCKISLRDVWMAPWTHHESFFSDGKGSISNSFHL